MCYHRNSQIGISKDDLIMLGYSYTIFIGSCLNQILVSGMMDEDGSSDIYHIG